jgi:hypothetical protein
VLLSTSVANTVEVKVEEQLLESVILPLRWTTFLLVYSTERAPPLPLEVRLVMWVICSKASREHFREAFGHSSTLVVPLL